eukprot:9044583-Pyramimonas_sp.AAC.1
MTKVAAIFAPMSCSMRSDGCCIRPDSMHFRAHRNILPARGAAARRIPPSPQPNDPAWLASSRQVPATRPLDVPDRNSADLEPLMHSAPPGTDIGRVTRNPRIQSDALCIAPAK